MFLRFNSSQSRGKYKFLTYSDVKKIFKISTSFNINREDFLSECGYICTEVFLYDYGTSKSFDYKKVNFEDAMHYAEKIALKLSKGKEIIRHKDSIAYRVSAYPNSTMHNSFYSDGNVEIHYCEKNEFILVTFPFPAISVENDVFNYKLSSCKCCVCGKDGVNNYKKYYNYMRAYSDGVYKLGGNFIRDSRLEYLCEDHKLECGFVYFDKTLELVEFTRHINECKKETK